MHLCIFEDSLHKNFFPLVSLRPVSDLSCGTGSLMENTSRLITCSGVSLFVRTEIAALAAEEHPGVAVNALPAAQILFVNARVVADERLAASLGRGSRAPMAYVQDGTFVAIHADPGTLAAMPDLFVGGLLNESAAKRLPATPIACRIARYPWDLVRMNAEEIERHAARLMKRTRKRIAGKIYPGASLVARKNILLGAGSVVKPGVVLDAEGGPIVIGKRVTIMPNAVIQGPASIGDDSTIKIGAKIYHGTSIGRACKVGGEVEASILLSYTNKQHDGFLGHSYLGSWVNLGADTNTSDLKNTYGTVRVELQGTEIETGEMFVGLTMGDHSKTGINVMFDTGTIVGVSCNIYGAHLPPKFVPSFSWGEGSAFVPYELEKCIETARRVMARRDVAMSRTYESLLRAIHAASAKIR